MEIKFVGSFKEIKAQMADFFNFDTELVPTLPAQDLKTTSSEKRKPGRPPLKKSVDSSILSSNLVGAVGVEPTTPAHREGSEPVAVHEVESKIPEQKVEALPEPSKKITKDELTEVFKKLCEKQEGLQTFRTVLAEFGAKRLGEVTEDKYEAMYAKASSLL